MTNKQREAIAAEIVGAYIRESDKNFDKIIERDQERDDLLDFLAWFDDTALAAAASAFGVQAGGGGKA